MKRIPAGVVIFGALLIFTSIVQIRTIATYMHFAYYDSLFRPMPEVVIVFRGFVSLALRIAGLTAGVGLLSGKDMFRKTALFIAVVTASTFYFKHPYYAVKKHAALVVDYVAQRWGYWEITSASTVELIAKVSTFALWAIDAGFSLVLIYYFTRPQIKKWFAANAGSNRS